MNKLHTRKAAAKILQTSATVLKELEATGVAQVVRDEKKRPRYTAEMIEALRPVVASMAPQFTPAPAQPQMSPMPMPSAEQYLEVAPTPEQAVRPTLTPDEESMFQAEFAYTLAAEAARFGVTTAELLDAWQRANLPIALPQSFVSMLSDWSPKFGMGIEEMWQTALVHLLSVPLSAPQAYVSPRPAYPMSSPSYGYGPSPTAALGQYGSPQFPTPYPAAFMPPQPQVRPRFAASPRMPGYYPTQPWNTSGFVPSPFSVPPQPSGPVADARAAFEVARIEQERRRMERAAEAEDEARIKAEEREATRAANMERAQALAFAQAAAQQQHMEKQAVLQRSEEAKRHAAAQEEARQQRDEQERIERAVASIFADIPAFVPPDAVENIRQQVWSSIQGKSAAVAPAISRDIVTRAVAPFQEEARRMELRHKVAAIVVGADQMYFFRDGPEVQAVAAQAAQSFLDSGAVDHLDVNYAIAETRRVRDAAVAAHKKATAAGEPVNGVG
ncbi:MAG: hypothetical protein M0R80_31265 [Proteobacteria bacterium]|jgi:hypothetical protein|nr:hypothetical protein [Pseudomonadota bacterium]